MLANVLISNDKIKFTSKFLAAMCKGIPIVTFAWLDQCYKHKKALSKFQESLLNSIALIDSLF